MSRCAFSFSVALSLTIPGFLVAGDDRDLPAIGARRAWSLAGAPGPWWRRIWTLSQYWPGGRT